MTDIKKPTLADLIASTPGAQSREAAQASIAARRARLLNSAAPSPPEDFTASEPLPIVGEPDVFAQAFFQRLLDKASPPRPSKPCLVVDNKGQPPTGDDDPEPPKAA